MRLLALQPRRLQRRQHPLRLQLAFRSWLPARQLLMSPQRRQQKLKLKFKH